MARKSAANASGSPWKLPFDSTSPSSSTIGLSIADDSSTAEMRRANSSVSRAAPATCGLQRTEYESCTACCEWRCEVTIWEPLMSRARLAALAACPGCGRTSWSRAWKVRSVPSSASADIAAVTSAVRNRRSASAQARRSMPSMPSVPLISANPSFVSSFTGLSFADLSACAAGLAPAWPSSTSPSPTRARPMWASGARSPLQPTEPNRGTNGVMPSLSIAIRASASTGRTPDSPIARVRARRSMVARTTSWSTGGPTPAACDRMRASWSSGCRSGAMRVPASAPKPVDTPYTGSRDAAARSTRSRLRSILVRAAGARVTFSP